MVDHGDFTSYTYMYVYVTKSATHGDFYILIWIPYLILLFIMREDLRLLEISEVHILIHVIFI